MKENYPANVRRAKAILKRAFRGKEEGRNFTRNSYKKMRKGK